MNLQALYDERGKKLHMMEELVKNAGEERGLNADEEKQYNGWESEFDELTRRIQRAEKLQQLKEEQEAAQYRMTESTLETRNEFTTTTPVDNQVEKPEKRTYSDVWKRFMTFGQDSLSREDRQILLGGYERRAGATDPQVSSTAAQGGYLSPEEWANQVIETMKQYGGMYEAATVFTTRGGDTLHIPTEDVTAQLGAPIAQAAEDAISDTEWGELTMGAHTYTSKIILISEELYAEDDAFNVLGRVAAICGSRVGRKVNLDWTVGDGSSGSPMYGLMEATTGASEGKVGASTTAVTRDDLLDLVHSVDPAYRMGSNVGFMFNDSTLAAIKKLDIGGASDNRGLWQPSLQAGVPDRIDGYRYYINQDMASMAASAKAIAFGDLSKYWIRQVRGFTLRRSTERYFERRSVGYFMTARFDGKLSDQSAVKYFQNAAA